MKDQNLDQALESSMGDSDFHVAMLAEELVHRVALRVRDFRKANGMSQRFLADQLGTKQPRVALIESGESNLTLRSLAELAYHLGRDPEDFVADRATYQKPAWGRPSLVVQGTGVDWGTTYDAQRTSLVA